MFHQSPFTSVPKTHLFGLYMEISRKAYGFPVYVYMSSAVLSSECVKALQPPISEEAVCLVGRVLDVTSS